jgi:CHAD domain-containing protein
MKLKKKKNLDKEFRKLFSQSMELALKNLKKRSKSTRGIAVHETRKEFKKMRGLLRLLRFQIGEEIFSRENRRFRDAGRPLSEVRDADVMIETLNDLLAHFKKEISSKPFRSLRRRLEQRRRDIRNRIIDREKAMSKVTQQVRTAKKALERWPPLGSDSKKLTKGIRKVYARGQSEMQKAIKDPTVENLHEWRKSAKYLRYQLEMLESTWPEMIRPLAEQSKLLGDFLGTDHDLVVLKDVIDKECPDACDDTARETLLGLIHQRRTELESDAFELGQKIYTESGKQFSQRFKQYWTHWQAA